MDDKLYLKNIGKLKFECYKINGEKLIVDATLNYGGEGLNYSPLDLMLFSLGSCVGVTFTKLYPLNNLNIEISSNLIKKGTTHVFDEIELTLNTKDKISKNKLDKIINTTILTCPVHAMFKNFSSIKIIFITNNKEYIYS